MKLNKKIPTGIIIILMILSLVISRSLFLLIDDPEGPNLLIVSVGAIPVFFVLWTLYSLICQIIGKSSKT